MLRYVLAFVTSEVEVEVEVGVEVGAEAEVCHSSLPLCSTSFFCSTSSC